MDGRVVVHHNKTVRGKVHIEFTAPEAALLGRTQRRNGIFRIPCLLALPESAVGTDFLRLQRESAQQESRHHDECVLFEPVHLTNLHKKRNRTMCLVSFFSRDDSTRTSDPYVPNVVRYQLRYIPLLIKHKLLGELVDVNLATALEDRRLVFLSTA